MTKSSNILSVTTLWIIAATAAFAQSIAPSKNVSLINGTQIIEIVSEGGYFPELTVARANVPTIIKMKTVGSFDCGLAFTIPKLKYRKMLPVSGETLIDIPAQPSGTKIEGLCSMAMYKFTIAFE